jgi:hypothetical protein
MSATHSPAADHIPDHIKEIIQKINEICTDVKQILVHVRSVEQKYDKLTQEVRTFYTVSQSTDDKSVEELMDIIQRQMKGHMQELTEFQKAQDRAGPV